MSVLIGANSFVPLKSSGVQQQYPVCPPVKSQFHFKVLICQVQRYIILQQNIFKYTAFNFYPWRALPSQKINEEKNQTARHPQNYRPSNYPISLLGCAGLPSYFPSFLWGFLRTHVRPRITLLTCLAVFFAHALCLHLFPFCSSRIVSEGLPVRRPKGSFCPKRSEGKKIASGNLTA